MNVADDFICLWPPKSFTLTPGKLPEKNPISMVEVGTWLILALSPVLAIGVVILLASIYFRAKRPSKFTVAFFHPYCNDGGGGERVLWRAIDALQRSDIDNCIDIVVYSGDKGVSGEDILIKAKARFAIELMKTPKFVFLTKRDLVEASRYPSLTMFGQSLGSLFLGFEALTKLTPHVYIDSMGYSWTFPIFSVLGGAYVAAYVHYPTISTDMLSKVSNRSHSFNNNSEIASSGLRTTIKLFYYRIFAAIYGWMGKFSKLTMTNSSWTRDHIKSLWQPKVLELVYPPCDTRGLQALPLEGRNRRRLVSIAQFRPEKNHLLQIQIVEELKKRFSNFEDVVLYMIGSLRSGNEQDEALVNNLKSQIKEKGLEKNVIIATNVSNDVLKQHFANASIGIHTMSEEHFGIGVVELQAAGMVPLAHNSAGPRADIVLPQTGLLASSLDEYVHCLSSLLTMPDHSFEEMAKNARQNANRFSDEEFTTQINRCFRMIPSIQKRLK